MLCVFIQRLIVDQGTHLASPMDCLATLKDFLPRITEGLHLSHRLELQNSVLRVFERVRKRRTTLKGQDVNVEEDLEPKNKRQRRTTTKSAAADEKIDFYELERFVKSILPAMKSASTVSASSGNCNLSRIFDKIL